MDELASDIDRAASNLLHPAKPADDHAEHGPRDPKSQQSTNHLSLTTSVKSFKDISKKFLERERMRHTSSTPTESDQTHNENQKRPREDADAGGRTVLTLFGNAQGQKQLFSSFQKSSAKRLKTESSNIASQLGAESGFTFLPIQGSSLPNQISVTQVFPHDQEETAPQPPSKFRDLFRPPNSLPALSPPKSNRHVTTRESAITWSQDKPSQTSNRKPSYPEQKLPTGQWLGYGGLPPAQEPSSVEAKRKRRDRALSTGEAAPNPSDSIRAAQARAKEDALFRGAYSSFAPCRDTSFAVIPEEAKTDVWWEIYGRYEFDNVFSKGVSDQNGEVDAKDSVGPLDQGHEEEEEFKKAVNDFEPDALKDQENADELDAQQESDKTLTEISSLLETLQSCQRSRNSIVNANGRPNTELLSSLQKLTGTPSAPTEAERENYKKVKAQLADLVGKLPPYAVAKVNGQQDSDLLFRRLIQIEGKSYKGVMEEDQMSRNAKASALNAALGGSAAAGRPATGSRATQMARTPGQAQQGSHGMNSAPRTAPAGQRQQLSSWQTPAQAYASSMQRSQHGQQPGYNRPPPLSTFLASRSQQTNGTGPPFLQAPSQPAYQQRAQAQPWGNSPYRPPSQGQGQGQQSARPPSSQYGQQASPTTAQGNRYAASAVQPAQTQRTPVTPVAPVTPSSPQGPASGSRMPNSMNNASPAKSPATPEQGQGQR